MTDTFWKQLTEYGIRVIMPKDVVLNYEYDKHLSNYVYLLEDGICALTSITKQGEEKVYLYFHPHRIIAFNQFIVSPCKLTGSGPVFSILTRTECVLYQIPCSTFRDLINHDTAFNKFLIETLADNYNDALIHFHLMHEESVVVRLCHLLFEVSQTKAGRQVVPRFFTYAELAKYLGCHPVTVSRIMAKLKQQGYIIKAPEGIVLEKKEALQELINSESHFQY